MIDYRRLIKLNLIIFCYTHNIYVFQKCIRWIKTVKYITLKIFSHFSVTNVDCIVGLLLLEMIKIFVYIKTEKYIVNLLI